MWEQIGAAAIYGAIGGGAGALIGSLLATPFRNTKIGGFMMTALAAAGAVIGFNVSEPLLKPYIGQYLPSPVNDTEKQIEEALDELGQIPIYAAILERKPEIRSDLAQLFRDVVGDASSGVAARQLAFSAAYNEVQGQFIYFLQRGQKDDLITFFRGANEDLIYFTSADPKFCFDSNYNPGALAALDLPALKAKYGEDRFNASQKRGAEVVRNADDDVPNYDADAAQLSLQRAGEILVAKLGEEDVGMVTGAKAVSRAEDFKRVCDATIAINESILGEANAADVIRHIYLISGG